MDPRRNGKTPRRLLAIAFAVLGFLVFTPGQANAHGTGTYTLCNNCYYDRQYQAPYSCLEREQHGNYGTQGYSQSIILSGSSCIRVSTYVTACSGLNCPDWPSQGGSSVGYTYQSTANSGYLIVWSPHTTQTGAGTFTYHANI